MSDTTNTLPVTEELPSVDGSAPAMSRLEALRKWWRFTDSALGAFHNTDDVVMQNLVAAGATEELLKSFWLEVKHLSWASTFGQSPWEIAAWLAASLEARDLGIEFRRIGERYVKPFQDALAKRQQPIVLKNSDLKPFRVMLLEQHGDRFKLAYDCDALDADHAAEQAEDAYPGCEVLSCTWYDWRDTSSSSEAA